MKILVKILRENEEIASKLLEVGIYRAGRSDMSDLVLDDERVSRSHFELRVTDSSVYLTNMSSSGRLKVNGKAVETAELGEGDEVSVGPFKLLVLSGDAAEMPAPITPDLPVEPANPLENNFGEMPAEPVPAPETPVGEEEAESPVAVVSKADSTSSRRFKALLNEPPPAFEGTAALNRAETVVEMKPVVAKLVFLEGPRQGEELFIDTYEISFGRSKKADIFLDDEKLSRVHAKIARVGNGYRLIDLNSRNGTYVNGVRVLEHPLSSFDTVEIGSTKIKFLIHDIVAGDMSRAGGTTELATVGRGEQTKSLQMSADEQARLLMLQQPNLGGPVTLERPDFGNLPQEPTFQPEFPPESKEGPPGRTKIVRLALVVVLLLGAALFLMPDKKPQETKQGDPPATLAQEGAPSPPPPKGVSDLKVPPAISKEFLDLSPEMQRTVEGYYNSALRSADRDNYEEAVANLNKIHEVLPYYKQSKDLKEQYMRKVRDKQIAEAEQKAKKDEKQDIQILVEDGLDYLTKGEWENAAEAFTTVMTMDPNNQIAPKGIRAAELKIRRIEDLPPEKDPEQEKRKLVRELFQRADESFRNKRYQETIELAEQIRKIPLQNDTEYINTAKQVIDRARIKQKEEFEPFITEAKEKFAEGDYNSSRDLCEEMLKRDPAYEEAKECVFKAKKQLNRLAKEAYVHGYILESMNRLEEAKQYWNRAKNYVRPGDDYYDKVVKKLEYYQ